MPASPEDLVGRLASGRSPARPVDVPSDPDPERGPLATNAMAGAIVW